MPSLAEVLALIAERAPDLARRAETVRRKPDDVSRRRAAAKLVHVALRDPRFEPDEERLRDYLQANGRELRSAQLPPIRITDEQLATLNREAAAAGLSLSDHIRRRLFG